RFSRDWSSDVCSSDLAQAHRLRAAEGAGAAARGGVEFAVEVGFQQAVETDLEVGGLRLDRHLQRIEIGAQVAARTVGGDQLEHQIGRASCRERVSSAG